MKRRVSSLILAAALALSACNGGEQPIETVTPTPVPPPTASESTPTPPSATPSLSQEELSAQAEQAYRAFFAEWVRLQRLGGTETATTAMTQNAAGAYLEAVLMLLKEQQDQGVKAGGPPPELTVTPAPGSGAEGSDPRLTLNVCEDNSRGWYEDESGRYEGGIAEGTVYLQFLDGRPKVVFGETESVQSCTP